MKSEHRGQAKSGIKVRGAKGGGKAGRYPLGTSGSQQGLQARPPESLGLTPQFSPFPSEAQLESSCPFQTAR